MAAGTRVTSRVVVPTGDGTTPGISCPMRLLQGVLVLAAIVAFGFAVGYAWAAAIDSMPQPYKAPTLTGCAAYGPVCAIGGVR
ncbi:hypothetical protein GCM10027258_63130 [Amycolatopsis stemonae]